MPIQEISATGATLVITASETYPNGVTIKQFSDDGAPFETQNVAVSDTGVALNGNMVRWATLNLVDLTVSLVPGSDEDKALFNIWKANRCYPGHQPVFDKISATITYLSGDIAKFTNGTIIDGPPALSGSSEGRLNTNTYSFRFETVA